MIVEIDVPWYPGIKLKYPVLKQKEYPFITVFNGFYAPSEMNIESSYVSDKWYPYDFRAEKIITTVKKGEVIAVIHVGDDEDIDWEVTQEIIPKQDIEIITDGLLDEELIAIFIPTRDNKEFSYSGEYGCLDAKITADINKKLGKNYKYIFISEV
jgi:hypothetical protein